MSVGPAVLCLGNRVSQEPLGDTMWHGGSWHGLVLVGGGGYYRIREGALVQGAKVLGSYGRLAARARQYAVEVELWRWWQEEVAWMRSPKAGVRNGPRVHEDQAVLVVSTLRGDHAVARLRVGRRIVTA